MGNQLRNPEHGIKFAVKPKKPDQPVQPDQPSPTDAVPARNDIWDSQNGNDIDKVALHGFTIPELIDLGALAATNEETNVLPNNLENDVHLAFTMNKWETSVPSHFKRKHMFPLSPGSNGRPRPGNYTANNLLVWKALLPCLRLASKFLDYAHIFPWYHAFLHSDIYPITNTTPEAKTPATPLRKLLLPIQSDIIIPSRVEATHRRIFEISQYIRLGISDGNVDPIGNNPELRVKYDGVAIPPWEDDNRNYRIYLAYQIIEPLLENEIGPSTRLALQFHVALTLLHEFAHVLVFAKDGSRDIKLYLDNERIPEAGFSFEMNTFGGHPVLLLQRADTPDYDGPLRAGFFLEDWLGTAKGHQWNKPLSGTDADWNDREWRETRSIPISFLEELGQEEFWRCFVGTWGPEALKVYPWTEGRLVQRSGNALKTQIYSTPKQDRAWSMAAQQVSHKNPGPLTPDETIALRIANRRISREKEINTLVKTRRKLEQQKKQGQSQKTPPPELTTEDDTEADTQRRDDPAAVAIAEPGYEKPWEVRPEDIERMKEVLAGQLYKCAEDDERIQEFLERDDYETPEYDAAEKALWKTNKTELKRVRKLIEDAFDDELLEGYESILRSYKNMKGALERDSRQTSEDRDLKEIEQHLNDHCTALLRRAIACRDRGEHKKCCDYCELIFKKKSISLSLRARTFHLCGLSQADLSKEDLQWKVWYLMEAVRLYKLLERDEGEFCDAITLTRRQHAEERLVKAEERLRAAGTITDFAAKRAVINAAEKDVQPGPKIIKLAQLGTPPKTPPKPKDPKPNYTNISKKPSKPFTGFDNPPSTPLTPPINLDPAPEGMSPVDIVRHRRTFKVINQARRNFMMGDYDLAERGFLELLDLQATSEWQRARCHVYLASIQTRNDRAERAQTALNMYRGFLRKWPEDERCVTAVKEAEELGKRVFAELEWQNDPETKRGEPVMSGGLGNGHAGNGLETIAESDGESEIDVLRPKTPPKTPLKTPTQKKEEEPVGFVAGIFDKMATFLRLKRRREEDDDGENERGSKGPRRPRVA